MAKPPISKPRAAGVDESSQDASPSVVARMSAYEAAAMAMARSVNAPVTFFRSTPTARMSSIARMLQASDAKTAIAR